MAELPDPVLDYLSYGAAPGAATRLVVLLHGYGRDGSVMEKMALACAEHMPHAAVMVPHGPEIQDIFFDGEDEALAGRQWFSLRGGRSHFWPRLQDASRLINGFLDAQCRALGLEAYQAALMGFSQGGALATYAAFLRDAPLGCAVAHSSLFLTMQDLKSKAPLLYIYGTEDEEFTDEEFEASIFNLSSWSPDLTVKTVEGLGHRTNAISRAAVADYIARRLG